MSAFKTSVTKVSAVFTILISSLVLGGWFGDIAALKSVFPGIVSMKFNTAVCFLLLGISLFFHAGNTGKRATNSCFALVAVVGFLTLSQYLFGLNLGIDELLWREGTGAIATSSPGRMSPATAFLFLMLGTSLLCIRNRALRFYVQLALFLSMTVAAFGLFGYVFGTSYLYSVLSFTQIALHTVISFMVLCLGIFYSPALDYLKFSFEKKITAGFGIVVIVLFTMFFAFSRNNDDFIDTIKRVDRIQVVQYQCEQLVSGAKDNETGSRGYVITGDKSFLEPYEDSKVKILNYLSKLKKLTDDSPVQQLRINVLEKLLKQRLDFSEKTVMLRKNKGFEVAKELVATGKGKALMDGIRLIVKDIQKEEHSLLAKNKADSQKGIENSNRMIVFFQATIIVVLLVLFVIILRTFKVRMNAEVLLQKSKEAIQQSEANLKFALDGAGIGSWGLDLITHEADRSLKHDQIFGYQTLLPEWSYELFLNKHVHPEDRKQVDTSFQTAVANGSEWHFECRIFRVDGSMGWIWAKGRTFKDKSGKPLFMIGFVGDMTELKNAEARLIQKSEELLRSNKELDSFSYSVSHDLRAPLRAIDGYTRILKEDYGDKIDKEGQRIMDVVINNTRQMEKLVDDLLAFSRLGKQNLIKVGIDMNSLVSSVTEELREQSSRQEIELDVKPLIRAQGDSSMIKQLMVNLVSNAIKYSEKKEKSIVEIDCYEEKGQTVYYVKDNGAGFDMLYYDKLFGVFQRLHAASEFEGTGVGLASAQRIVGRHGGEIWAEGKVDEGAVFYFSLPNV